MPLPCPLCWLVGNRVPVRTDLCGALLGWWRFEQDGEPLAPDALVGSVAPDLDLVLCFVRNHQELAEIEVQTEAGVVRFFSPVGTAVPVATIIDHLAGRCGLGAGLWVLFDEGVALSPWAILSDRPASGEIRRLSLHPEPRL